MLIVANWKAYVEDAKKAKALVTLAKKLVTELKHEIVLAPSAPLLGLLAEGNKSKMKFAAQNISASTGGAKTGEDTAKLCSALGATYTLVGHSERRALGETDEIVSEKARHALAHGLTPILCVGEHERDSGAEYLAFVRAQISAVMAPLSQKERLQVVIAYEPIWAIGKSALEAIQPHDLAEMVLYIRKVLGDFLPGKAPAKSRILYGGSVEPANARDLAGGSHIDGLLVGHASVDPQTFTALVKAVS